MNRKHYFISDVHLGRKGKEEREKKILSFLEFIKRDASSLFILGDLFDFWWEYKTVIPKDNLEFFFRIRELIAQGVKIYYLPGNHDWTAGRFFSGLGVVVAREMEILLFEKPVFLIHGDFLDDSLLTNFSRFAYRFPISHFLFSLLHPNLGIPLARNFIGISGGTAWVKHLEKKFLKFAEEKIREGFFLVGLGHIHTPSLEKIGDGYYLNPGDWLSHFTYGVLDDKEGVKLEKWEG
ncbi:MAG: UDP-2,3-diacylglucosamine diphosphatase [candidate division WOR-3 bacterium]